MQAMSCNLGRLGSRLNIIFEPANRQIRQSALGLFLDQPGGLIMGLEDEHGNQHVFPLTGQGTMLRYVETRLTPTSVTWVGACVPLFLQVEATLTAPFWPQDEATSLWPGYYIEIAVRPMIRIRWHKPKPVPARVKVIFGLDREGRRDGDGAMRFRYQVPLVPHREDTVLADWPLQVDTRREAVAEEWIGPVSGGWRRSGDLWTSVLPVRAGTTSRSKLLQWVAHTKSTVLEVGGDPARFRYCRYWPSLSAAVAHGRRQATRMRRKSRKFDDLIASSALSATAKKLFAQSFQSFLMNTWWCETNRGREWYSVWEGNCLFHSTVDVEYNVSLFYLSFWPRLLRLSLEQWTDHLQPNPNGPGRYLDHDMGAGILANGNQYGHRMGVEEAANYLLLLLAHVRFNGDQSILRKRTVRLAVADLVEYLLWTDQRGRGFPSEDVWNTIDDSAPAIQFGRQQTYLAVKRLAALRAAQSLGVNDLRCEPAIQLAKQTLVQQAWLGDHFAVCLDRNAAEVIDPNTGRPPGKGLLKGWDDYHIYSSNGLLLLAMTDGLVDDDLLPLMRQDLATALPATLGPYGCSHSSGDKSNVWVSQNIWRDCVGHYLGQPMPDLTDRYWDLQVWSNTREQAKCFADTYIANNLSRYPRGIACAGYLMSLAGLVLDRTRGVMQFAPVIRDGELPLFPLADWKKERIPYLVVRNNEWAVSYEIAK